MACCGPKPKSGELRFNANYHKQPLRYKFWSKYDQECTKATNDSKIVYYEKEIEKHRKFDARYHSKMPRYTNQTYGWLPGYKICFLQNCEIQIYRNPAIQKMARDFFTSTFQK